MRLLICGILIMLLISGCSKNEQQENADKFGEGITLNKAVTMPEVLNNPESYDGQEIVVESTIKTVCQARGCWMEVESGILPMRISFKNDSFFIPKDAARRKVKMQGVLKVKEVSEEVARNYLKDAGRSDEEIGKINGAQRLLTMVASGLVIYK